MGLKERERKRDELRRISKLSLSSEELKQISTTSCWTCLFCKLACPFYEKAGKWLINTPFGRIRAFKYLERWGLSPDKRLHEATYLCTTCGRCISDCSTGISLPELTELYRSELYYKYKIPLLNRHEEVLSSCQKHGNPYFEPRENRFAWLKEPVSGGGDFLYFVGCTSAYRMTDIAKSTAELFRKLGVNFSVMDEETCCGSTLLRLGLVEEAKKLAMENAGNMNKAGVRKVITSCAGCYRTLSHDYPKLLGDFDVEVFHSSQILHELMKKGVFQQGVREEGITVTYHDPCHIGRHCDLYDEPRALIGSLRGVNFVEMAHSMEDALCCGAGGGVRAAFKEKSLEVAKDRIREAVETGAQYLISTCPFCKLQLAEASEGKIKVLDLTEFLMHYV